MSSEAERRWPMIGPPTREALGLAPTEADTGEDPQDDTSGENSR